MDILMTYWSSVWKQAVVDSERRFRNHTSEELRAFERSLRRRQPARRGTVGKSVAGRRKAPTPAH